MLKVWRTLLFITGLSVGLTYAQDDSPSGTQIPESVQSMHAESVEETFSYEQLRRFARAFALVKNQYVEPISDEKLVDAAIAGMMNELDPHSSYLNKDDMIDLQEETEGEFGGLGIEVGEDNGFVKIISPIEGTPAAKAGVLPGDVIVKINGEEMKGKQMSEVIKLLRGDPGTTITLTLRRAKSPTLVDLEIKRELIKGRSVRSKMIDDTAYFRISQFQTNTVNDLVHQIRAIKTTPNSIVLDLRNDPGGLLNVSVGVVQIFSDTKRTIVSTKARNHVVEEFSRYTPDNILQTSAVLKDLPNWLHSVPMVVLLNVGSASASEIVAGALQDFKRATIMGNRSFGKGSVQVVLAIDEDTGIKLTTARYYTPNGRSIQAKGIKPDIVVSDTAKGDLFRTPREADLADHLKNENAEDDTAVDKDNAVKEDTKQETEAGGSKDETMYEFGSDQDFQLQQALNYLHGKPVNQGVVADAVKINKSAEGDSGNKTLEESESNTKEVAEPAKKAPNDATQDSPSSTVGDATKTETTSSKGTTTKDNHADKESSKSLNGDKEPTKALDKALDKVLEKK
ncbi:S41 family peptidase [Pelistega europaea]|uniref:S41 family peptidase n=1 Tax=Pelistega europaea TaxID=106147 RepID=A0A7Y4L868_9BURK|nr:S41 family peptidase [Pelistega europaea]NOL48775.1 S41 family peptidase [Pelistega europaea]